MLLNRIYSFLFAVPILLSVAAEPVRAAAPQRLRGHVPPGVAGLQPLNRLAGGNRLDLTIALPLRNRDALTNLLEQLYDPASSNYHHYLTAAEFASQFGPTEKDYQQVIVFARSNGLTVTG